jgi:hypothetical protein
VKNLIGTNSEVYISEKMDSPLFERINWSEVEVSERMINLYIQWWANTWFEDWLDLDPIDGGIPPNEWPKDFAKARANKLYQLRKSNFDQSFKIWYVMQPVLNEHAESMKFWMKHHKEAHEQFVERYQTIKALEEKIEILKLKVKAKPEMKDFSHGADQVWDMGLRKNPWNKS